MKVTIRDIAEKAGVSASTVSLALNDSSRVKQETGKKIRRLADRLHYVPDTRARALKKGITGMIAVVVPRIDNYFFAELTQSIKFETKKAGYNVILCSTDGNVDEELNYVNAFKSGLVDGAIFGPNSQARIAEKAISELVEHFIPVVFVDRPVDSLPVFHVKADLKNSTKLLTEYLIELGHRRIAYVGLDRVDGGQPEERLQGFEEAAENNGIDLPKNHVVYSFDSYEGGMSAGEKIAAMEERYTALVCMNDEIALGAMNALMQQGIKVPDEVSVCGTDNLKISGFSNPPLTTVNIDKKEMGKTAAKVLIDLIAGEGLAKENRVVEIPTELIIRDSTGPNYGSNGSSSAD